MLSSRSTPVDADQVLAERVAAPRQRVGDRAQRVGEVLRLDRLQQRQRVVDHPLQLDRVLGAVLAMTSPSAEPVAAAAPVSRATNRSPNSVLGSSRALTSAGIWSRSPADRQLDGRAVGAGRDLAHLAHDDAAHLDVGRLLSWLPGGVGLQRHRATGVNALLVRGHRQAEQQRQDDEERQTPGGGAGCQSHRSCAHPAIRTVVVEPQMASDRKKSMMLTATIENRTARPTATPTPAGPPVAR